MGDRYGARVEALDNSAPQSNSLLNAADYQAGVTVNAPAKTTDVTSGVLPGLTLFTAADSVAQRSNTSSEQQLELNAIGVAHDQIQNQEKGKLTAEQFVAFQNDMRLFETRMAANPEEITQTYAEISRILAGNTHAAVDANKLGSLALDVLHQAANPQSIHQGNSDTCAVASLESRIYTRHPSQAAKLVADVALSSQFDGLAIDRGTVNHFTPAERSLADNTDFGRSHASQIFQFTAINLYMDADLPQRNLDYRYAHPILDKPQEGRFDKESGILKDTQPHVRIEGDGVEILREVNNRIVGKDEANFIVALPQTPTEQDFRNTLNNLHATQNFPAILVLPISDSYKNGGTPYHALAIEPGADADHILVNDQFSDHNDKQMTVSELYEAMRLRPDLAKNEEWANWAVHAISTAVAKLEKNDGDEVAFQRRMLDLTPTQITSLEYVADQQNIDLTEMLAEHLPENQMRLLGYEKNWLGNWTHD